MEKLRLDRLGDLEPLRRQAWRWARDHVEELRPKDPVVPDQLSDRDADNWRPLLAIADLVGDTWPERARKAALLLSGQSTEADQAPAIQLLADLRELFYPHDVAGAAEGGQGPALEPKDHLTSSEITEQLGKREDRPWSEWRRGKPITPRQLAGLLKRFGIRPKAGWVGGKTLQRYERKDFEDSWARYRGSDPQGPQGSSDDGVKPANSDPQERLDLVDTENLETPRADANLVDLVDQTPGLTEEIDARPGDLHEPEDVQPESNDFDPRDFDPEDPEAESP